MAMMMMMMMMIMMIIMIIDHIHRHKIDVPRYIRVKDKGKGRPILEIRILFRS